MINVLIEGYKDSDAICIESMASHWVGRKAPAMSITFSRNHDADEKRIIITPDFEGVNSLRRFLKSMYPAAKYH